MKNTTGIHPTQVVERRKRPKLVAANRNAHKDSAALTVMIAMTPRDMAALSEVLDPDAALNSVENYTELSVDLIERGLSHVVAPLTTTDFDALDIAWHLSELGFCGVLQVLTPHLPRPEIVVREIEAAARNIHVELITPRAAWRTLA